MDAIGATGRSSAGCSAPPTRPRCSSGWPCSRGAYLQLDDVVVTSASCPTGEPVTIAGVVTQVRARHEGATFDSDVFAIADGTLPAQVQEAAEITTTRVEPGGLRAAGAGRGGAPGRRATARDGALYFDRMERRIPIGIGRDGEPLYLNADFLDGTRGAHVSISGISGVATKTSFATFLLYSVFRSGRARRRRRDRQHPGADLQRQGRGPALPRPPEHPARRRTTRGVRPARAWTPAPFPDVRVYAPPRAGDPSGTPDVASRLTGVDTLLLDAGRVLRRPAAAVRVRRRRRRAPAVHDGGALGRRPPGTGTPQPADGGVVIDGAPAQLATRDLVDHIVEQLTDDETRGAVGRQRGRPRHGQRVRRAG